jgi:hypothetical protein
MSNTRHVELHLDRDPELTAKYGKKIKELGGKYSECRGYDHIRYVDLPWTAAGRALATELMGRYPSKKQTIILRNFPRIPDVVAYGSVEAAIQRLRQVGRVHKDNGFLRGVKNAAARKAEKIAIARANVDRLRAAC